jgi:hypothetical protein
MAHEGWFIQKIESSGQEFDLALVQSCTYVETMDLSGPKLILAMHDPDSIIRDDFGVSPGSVLDITFADYFHEQGDEFVDRFTVLTLPDRGDSILINCMQSDVWATKTPAQRPLVFTRQPVAAILRRFFPGHAVRVDRFAVGNDYHVLPGERPAKVLRQLSAEIGARVYYHRKSVYAMRLETLFDQTAAFDLVYNDTREPEKADGYKIASYRRPNTEALVSDSIDRRWCGWDMIQGPMQSSRGAGFPAEWCGMARQSALDSLSAVPKPEVDLVLAGGMGKLRPGLCVNMAWYQDRIDSPMDESLPGKAVIGTAAHHYQAQKFLTRLKMVAPR